MNIKKLIGKKYKDNSTGKSRGCIIKVAKIKNRNRVWIEIVDDTNAKRKGEFNVEVGRKLYLSRDSFVYLINNNIFKPIENRIKKL